MYIIIFRVYNTCISISLCTIDTIIKRVLRSVKFSIWLSIYKMRVTVWPCYFDSVYTICYIKMQLCLLTAFAAICMLEFLCRYAWGRIMSCFHYWSIILLCEVHNCSATWNMIRSHLTVVWAWFSTIYTINCKEPLSIFLGFFLINFLE